MLFQWLSALLLWALGFTVVGVHGQDENDFENSDTVRRVQVSSSPCILYMSEAVLLWNNWFTSLSAGN